MAAHILCVQCNNRFSRFFCERCSDRYCSKRCQLLDWPIHKKICFPMPSLLEIPIEHHMMTMSDKRDGDSLALAYYTNCPNRYSNDKKSDNFTRAFYGQPFNKPFRRQLCDSSISEKEDSIFEAQPILPITMRDGAAGSNDFDEIVNLATSMKIDCKVPAKDKATKSERQMPHKPLNWDEDNTDHIHKLERLMPNDLRNWEKPFPLENDSSVAVVHFDESPTQNCWVVQNQFKTKRQHLLDELKDFHRNNKSAQLQKVTVNEVYSVQYNDNYYRGVCLYQVNSKEMIVRLIDVGLTFQTKISAMNTLAPRFRDMQALALEINLEEPVKVTMGQILKIKQYEVDETGKMYVKMMMPEVTTSNSAHHQTIKIETIPIPVGVPVELFCVDYGNNKKGYISVCINDKEKIKSIDGLSDRIENYLKSLGRNDPHSPKLDELCFAYHNTDRQWYRAECIGVLIGDKFEVLFLDYGITSIVCIENVRKFDVKFSQPSLMHFGYFKDLPVKETMELAKKIVKFFDECPIFPVAEVQYVRGMLVIDCPKLMRSIS